MKILDALRNKKTEEKKAEETNFVCGHLHARYGAQIGEYSLGVEEITYIDANGKERKKLVWTAQR